MPEQPALDALAAFLREHLLAEIIAEVRLGEISALKTAEIPLERLLGEPVSAVSRLGKYLDFTVGRNHLVVHFALLGWLKWYESAPRGPVRMTKSPLAMRVVTESGVGFDLTEQGTKKSLSVSVVDDPDSIARLRGLGRDVSRFDEQSFGELLAANSSRIKTVLTDQRLIAGIGNRWSDEILWTARLSPFATASAIADPVELFHSVRTVLDQATRGLHGAAPARIKAIEKNMSQVHGRTGEPCPRCGTTIAQVAYTDRSFQYCPECQTGGRRLSDRRMDRLLK